MSLWTERLTWLVLGLGIGFLLGGLVWAEDVDKGAP